MRSLMKPLTTDHIPTAREQIAFLLSHMTQQQLRAELNARRFDKDGTRTKREAVVLYELYLEHKEK